MYTNTRREKDVPYREQGDHHEFRCVSTGKEATRNHCGTIFPENPEVIGASSVSVFPKPKEAERGIMVARLPYSNVDLLF